MTKYVSYKTAIHAQNNHFILCNYIMDVDPESIWGNMEFGSDSAESDFDSNGVEIYQYYFTDCSRDDVDWLLKNFPDLIFSYSEKLDLYVLCVDHFGTSWNGVPTAVADDSKFLMWNPEKEYKN